MPLREKKTDLRYLNKILLMLSIDKNSSYFLLLLVVWAPLPSLPHLHRQFQSSKGMAGKNAKIGRETHKMAAKVKAGT